MERCEDQNVSRESVFLRVIHVDDGICGSQVDARICACKCLDQILWQSCRAGVRPQVGSDARGVDSPAAAQRSCARRPLVGSDGHLLRVFSVRWHCQTFAVAEKSTEAALRALEICMSMCDQRSNLHTRRDVSADMGVRTRVQTSIAQVKRAPSLAPPKRRRRP